MGRCYPHLNLEERRKLAKWLDAKIPIKEIADDLRRAPSTIYRHIYAKEGMAQELWSYLPLLASVKNPSSTVMSTCFSGQITSPPSPAWPLGGDLMLFEQTRGQINGTSRVECASRFTMMMKNPNKRTKPAMHCLSGD